MSRLIEPNLNGMTERQFKRKGQMNVTHDELTAELQSLAKAILDAFGPIAVLQGELMLRQQALEDSLQYCGSCGVVWMMNTGAVLEGDAEGTTRCRVCKVADEPRQYVYAPKGPAA